MRVIVGFIAGGLAVLLAHEPIIMLLVKNGILPATAVPYNMAPLARAPAAVTDAMKNLGFLGLPTLFNSVFWGGLWGVVFSLVHPRLPGGMMLIKGLIFGILVVIFSNWLILPFIRGTLLGLPNISYFAGAITQNPLRVDWMRLLPSLLILSGFGTGLGLIYGLLRRDRA